MKTRAAILHELNRPLEIGEVTVPPLKRGQVLVKVAWSGVCASQLMEARGYRGPDPYLPHLLGHEGSGEVVEIGDEVRKVCPGDHVVMTWIKGKGIDAGGSQYQKDDQTINAGGVTTFSEYTVVSENRCVAIDLAMDLEVASLLGCALPTGAGVVLNELQPSPGDCIAIFGLGGIGLSALMGAVANGYEQIIAVDVLQEKLDRAVEFGATHTLLADDNPAQAIRDLTKGKGVDFAVEAAGRTQSIETAFESVRDKGGLCIFTGHPPADQKICLEPHALIRGKNIRGSWGGGSRPDRDIPRFVEMYRNGSLPLEKLISHRLPLDHINKALDLLEAGGASRILIDLQA